MYWALIASFAFAVLEIGFAILFSLAALRWKPPERDGPRPQVSMIVPAWNEGGVLAAKAINSLQSLKEGDELIIALDGPDEEAQRVLATITGPRMQVLIFPHRNKAATVKDAALRARNDTVIVSDADVSLTGETIDILSRALVDGAAATGFQAFDGKGYIRTSEFAGALGNQLYRLGASVLASDPVVSGTFAVRRDMLPYMSERGVMSNVAEDLEFGLELRRLGHKVVFSTARYDITKSLTGDSRGLVKAKRRTVRMWPYLIRHWHGLWLDGGFAPAALYWTFIPFIEKMLLLLMLVLTVLEFPTGLDATPLLVAAGAILAKDTIRIATACKVWDLEISRWLPWAFLRFPVTLFGHLPSLIPVAGGWSNRDHLRK